MRDTNLKVKWIHKSLKQQLWFVFEGKLTTKDAEVAIEEWRKQFNLMKETSAVIVWDCRAMKGYEPTARSKWLEALKELKLQIETVWVISDSPFIRMGASFLGMLSSLTINAVSTENEIKT